MSPARPTRAQPRREFGPSHRSVPDGEACTARPGLADAQKARVQAHPRCFPTHRGQTHLLQATVQLPNPPRKAFAIPTNKAVAGSGTAEIGAVKFDVSDPSCASRGSSAKSNSLAGNYICSKKQLTGRHSDGQAALPWESFSGFGHALHTTSTGGLPLPSNNGLQRWLTV
jgi:hypothetical protein